jgi:hypothetical protein
MQKRDGPTPDVLELDRLAWNLPPAMKRPSPSQPPPSTKSKREDDDEAAPKAA